MTNYDKSPLAAHADKTNADFLDVLTNIEAIHGPGAAATFGIVARLHTPFHSGMLALTLAGRNNPTTPDLVRELEARMHEELAQLTGTLLAVIVDKHGNTLPAATQQELYTTIRTFCASERKAAALASLQNLTAIQKRNDNEG